MDSASGIVKLEPLEAVETTWNSENSSPAKTENVKDESLEIEDWAEPPGGYRVAPGVEHSASISDVPSARTQASCKPVTKTGSSKNRDWAQLHLRHMHRCPQCGKDFPTPSKLRVHQFSHTGEHPYLCTLCEQRFTQLANLKRHQQVKHPAAGPVAWQEPLVCRECSFGFVSLSQLQSHKCLLRCPQCSLSFPTDPELKAHIRTHKQKELDGECSEERGPDAEGLFVCSICKCPFAQQATLTQHLRHHIQKRQLVCDDCGREFALPCNLATHRRQVHERTPSPDFEVSSEV